MPELDSWPLYTATIVVYGVMLVVHAAWFRIGGAARWIPNATSHFGYLMLLIAMVMRGFHAETADQRDDIWPLYGLGNTAVIFFTAESYFGVTSAAATLMAALATAPWAIIGAALGSGATGVVYWFMIGAAVYLHATILLFGYAFARQSPRFSRAIVILIAASSVTSWGLFALSDDGLGIVAEWIVAGIYLFNAIFGHAIPSIAMTAFSTTSRQFRNAKKRPNIAEWFEDWEMPLPITSEPVETVPLPAPSAVTAISDGTSAFVASSENPRKRTSRRGDLEL